MYQDDISEEKVKQKEKIYVNLKNALIKLESANRLMKQSYDFLVEAYKETTARTPSLDDDIGDCCGNMTLNMNHNERLENRIKETIDIEFSEAEKIAYKVKFGL